MTQNAIVADGEERWSQTPEYLQEAAEIRQQVKARYQSSLAEAGLIGRIWLRFKMHLEIERVIRGWLFLQFAHFGIPFFGRCGFGG